MFCMAEKTPDAAVTRILQRGGDRMCIRKGQIGLVVLGIGVGLLLSFLLCGWFLQLAAALLCIGVGVALLR